MNALILKYPHIAKNYLRLDFRITQCYVKFKTASFDIAMGKLDRMKKRVPSSTKRRLNIERKEPFGNDLTKNWVKE